MWSNAPSPWKCICRFLKCVRNVYAFCTNTRTLFTRTTWMSFSVYQPPTDHLQTTYRPLTDYLPNTYRPSTDHLPTIYRTLTDHLPTTYRPSTDHLPTIYRPLTDHLPTTYQPPTDHLPTTYWPPTNHLPTTFLRCSLFTITGANTKLLPLTAKFMPHYQCEIWTEKSRHLSESLEIPSETTWQVISVSLLAIRVCSSCFPEEICFVHLTKVYKTKNTFNSSSATLLTSNRPLSTWTTTTTTTTTTTRLLQDLIEI